MGKITSVHTCTVFRQFSQNSHLLYNVKNFYTEFHENLARCFVVTDARPRAGECGLHV